MDLENKEVLDIDHAGLRSVLHNLTRELSVPFLERRGRTNIHKPNPVEELADIISELSDRERELQAAVGIANLLIDNNEAMKELYAEQTQKSSKTGLSFVNEITNLRKTLVKKSELFEQENDALMQTEQKLIELSRENRRLLQQLEKLKTLPELHAETVENHQETIDLLYSQHETKYIDLKNNVTELKRLLTQEKNSKKRIKKDLAGLQCKKSQLLEEQTNSIAKINKLKDRTRTLEHRRVELEEQNEGLRKANEKMSTQIKGLEVELKVTNSVKRMSLTRRTCISPVKVEDDELASLQVELSHLNKRVALDSVHLEMLEIFPSYHRKSPSEEFFNLVTFT